MELVVHPLSCLVVLSLATQHAAAADVVERTSIAAPIPAASNEPVSSPSSSATSPSSSSPSSSLTQTVAARRNEVEALASDVDADRQARREELLSLRRRKLELESKLALQRLSVASLRAQREARARQSSDDLAGRDAQRAPLRDALTALRALVLDGAPVDVDARLRAIAHASDEVEAVSVDAGAAAVWSIVRVEAELAGRVGRVRHPIVLDDKPVMAEIAHVGTALAWFRLRDGRVGLAQREHGAWRWRVVDDAAGRARLQRLFDALRRDAARGLFVVPNPLDDIPPVAIAAARAE